MNVVIEVTETAEVDGQSYVLREVRQRAITDSEAEILWLPWDEEALKKEAGSQAVSEERIQRLLLLDD